GTGADSVFLASDGARVIWTDFVDGKIRGAKLMLPYTEYLVTTLADPPVFGRIALRNGTIYVVGKNAVWMAAADGSQPTPTKVADKTSGTDLDVASGVAVDDTHVYWSDTNKIRRIPIAKAGMASAVEDFATAAGAREVAVDGGRGDWSGTAGLSWRNKTGGTITIIPVNDTSTRGLALDGNDVFTDTPDGRILRIKKGGSADDLVVVAMSPTDASHKPYDLAVDCGAVFWGQFVFGARGTVYRARR